MARMVKKDKVIEKKTLVLKNEGYIDNLDDFSAILICAVRYCLGRMTYMPKLVTSFIKRNLKDFITDNDITVMIQDIQSCNNYGHSCDEETWMDFLYWLKEVKKERDDIIK